MKEMLDHPHLLTWISGAFAIILLAGMIIVYYKHYNYKKRKIKQAEHMKTWKVTFAKINKKRLEEEEEIDEHIRDLYN